MGFLIMTNLYDTLYVFLKLAGNILMRICTLCQLSGVGVFEFFLLNAKLEKLVFVNQVNYYKCNSPKM